MHLRSVTVINRVNDALVGYDTDPYSHETMRSGTLNDFSVLR